MTRSGTEEDYNELQQLLEDIYTFKRDEEELKQRDKENKKQKEKEDHQKALAMRAAAPSGMAKRKSECSSDDESRSSDIEDNDNDGGCSTPRETSERNKFIQVQKGNINTGQASEQRWICLQRNIEKSKFKR